MITYFKEQRPFQDNRFPWQHLQVSLYKLFMTPENFRGTLTNSMSSWLRTLALESVVLCSNLRSSDYQQ